MLFKKLLCLCLAIVSVIGLCSCGCDEKVKTIADLAYDRSNEPCCVYVLEAGKYTPFLVLTDDYSGNTLLVRKDVVKKPGKISDYDSYYGDSSADAYLNGEYLQELSEIAPYIIDTSLEITSSAVLGTSGTETETISRKVFLLSCTEVGISDAVNIAREGNELDYFKDEVNRKAYLDGKPSSWWLRTPNTYYRSCTYVIGGNNKLGFTNAYDENGMRPAFCVKGDLPIELKADVVDDLEVYTFSFERN